VPALHEDLLGEATPPTRRAQVRARPSPHPEPFRRAAYIESVSNATVGESAALTQLRRGDIRGLETLVRAYQTRAVRAAYLVTRDRALAEEVVQEAFVRAYKRIGQLDQARPFEPWFLRSVVNAAARTAERERRVARLPTDDADARAAGGRGPEALAVAAQDREAVWTALGALAPGQRAAVVLRYFLDLDVAESAARLGAPVGTIKRRLHDARRRLRALLSPTLAEEPK
jgi:RNA polymerase sigma-70 factor (ECF subfamily)